MIIVTGAAGFIGSCIAKELNLRGRKDIVAVDELERLSAMKSENLASFSSLKAFDKKGFLDELESGELRQVDLIIHMGACSSTTETDRNYLMDTNLEFSKKIFDWCAKRGCRLIYASSAATYGDGSSGYSDDLHRIGHLQPLNAYGESKKLFDDYVLSSQKKPPQWAGLKFFNVYGPNEYHKGEMASIVFHAYNQIKKTGKVRLFKSGHADYRDGEQKRDFVYVKDVVSFVLFLMENRHVNGIFNVGTGKARTFKDIVTAVFSALNLKPNIVYTGMPGNLKGKYQYFTEADISKLRAAGYAAPFFTLEDGVRDYVLHYLENDFSHY